MSAEVCYDFLNTFKSFMQKIQIKDFSFSIKPKKIPVFPLILPTFLCADPAIFIAF